MPLRNPVYLDLELVQNVADYYDIDYPVRTQITETGTTTTSGGGRIGTSAANIGMDRTKGTEMQSAYEIPEKPLRVMNDVIDAVEGADDIKDAADTEGPSALSKGDLVRVEGLLALSAASVAGNMMAKFLPLMAESGGEMNEEIQSQILSGMLQGGGISSRQLYKVSGLEETRPTVLAIEPTYFFRNNSFEDLETEVTVFGSVERVVDEGQRVSLERWLLPDMDPTMRRALQGQGMETMLEGLGEMTEIDMSEATQLTGPALEIRPIAIY